MRELPAAPPAAFMSSGGWPLPFPRGLWEGWWAGPRVYEPQPLLSGSSFCSLAFTDIGGLLFLQLMAGFELSKLFG